MTRASFPDIPVEALRSHAEPARVERVWRRLELDAAGVPRERRNVLWWLPVASGIFALGVFVGARSAQPSLEMRAQAEPRALLPTPGAGPAAEREALPAQSQHSAPSKRARSARAVPSGLAPAEEYSDSYADPVGLTVSEPLPALGPAEWEKLAETGDFRAAKAALDSDGGFEQISARATASQLMVLADIARASGGRDQAMQALKRVLSTHVSSPEAPVAAWTLGNLLEQAGDRAGAADAYATYRRLSPAGDFAEDAAARQVDVALSQGNLELGTRAMEEYVQNFPKGRRMAELRKRLSALAGAAPPGAEPGGASADSEDDDEAPDPAASASTGSPAPAREP